MYSAEELGIDPGMMESMSEFNCVPFFKPDADFIVWLMKYAGNRVIVDIGSGSEHLAKLLVINGAKYVGIEPFVHPMIEQQRFKFFQANMMKNFYNVMPFPVQSERVRPLIGMDADKAMLLIARPCHDGFAADALRLKGVGVEALYIGLEENLKTDLGGFGYEKINHEGSSEDDEVVYSVK